MIEVTSIQVDPTSNRVTVKGRGSGDNLTYVAASPPDRRSSFTGSGLPFPSAAMAFSGRPNRDKITTDVLGFFQFTCDMPNAYYTVLGSRYVGPAVYVSDGKKIVTVPIYPGIPYRKLTYPNERRNVAFYGTYDSLPVRGQEEILRSSQYPGPYGHESDLFWGLKPPV